MDHIKDLKKLRDDALGRLQSNPDYRTLRALTALIDDLTLMDGSRAGVGDIPKADPAIIASMCLGVVMQSGQNKIYSRLPGPFSQHVEAFTRAIMAILHQR